MRERKISYTKEKLIKENFIHENVQVKTVVSLHYLKLYKYNRLLKKDMYVYIAIKHTLKLKYEVI